MRRKAKTGPPITRRDGKRMEVYVRPAAVVKQIEAICHVREQGRQEVLLGLILSGLAAQIANNTVLSGSNGANT